MKSITINNLKIGNQLEELDYQLTLIPIPINYKFGKSSFLLDSKSTISFSNINDEVKKTILTQIKDRFKEFGIQDIEVTDLKEHENLPISDDLKPFQRQQCYVLKIYNSKCIINSETDQGAYYGVQTLLQLMESDENTIIKLPEIEISDYPLLEIRGISDDITRGQMPTVDNIKRLIRLLSHYKMNFYFIGYETEFLENKKHPKISEGRGVLTIEEVNEVQEYARKHFIELVPFFQVLGHFDNILILPEYIDLAEFPGSQCLSIKDEKKVRSFLDDIIQNIAMTFQSKYIHIGGDESWDFGRYKSADIIKEKGVGNAYFDHYSWVYTKCKEYNKEKMLIYHDIVVNELEFIENFPKDVIMFYWNYFSSTKFSYRKSKKLRDYGFKVIVSPTIFNWSRFFPDFKWSTKNILSLFDYAKIHEFLGGIISQWGDYGHEDLRINHYYSYILGAGALWSDIDKNYYKFAFPHQFFGCKKNNLEIMNILDTLLSIHKYFSKLPPKFYIKFWEHPFLRKRPKINYKKYNKIENLADKVLSALESEKNNIKRNKDALDYIKFAAKLTKFIAIKFMSSDNISRTLLNPKIIENDSIKKGIINEIKAIKKMLKDLKLEYEQLWLKCSKREGLDRLLEKFDILDFYYQKKIDEINEGINWEDLNHPAKWISYPEKAPFQSPRYYRKIFTLEDDFDKYYLQCIANHFMKVYLNGEYLGYVISRGSLSYGMMDEQIKLFDISDRVKQGKNVIAIESYNFVSNNEGINVYCEFLNSDKSQIILSDTSWKSSLDYYENWTKNDFNDELWKSTKIVGTSPTYNGRIIKPYLKNGIKSVNTYNFGIRLMLELFLPSFLKPLIGIALRILGLE